MPISYQKEIEAILDVLKKLGKSIGFRSASKADLAYLRKAGYPDSVCDFYRKSEPITDVEINGVRLFSISELQRYNRDAIPCYIIAPMGYRVIADTVFGDAYCIDLNSIDSDGQPGVVLAGHDEIFEGATEDEIRAAIVEITDTFREFLRRFASKDLAQYIYDIRQDYNSK